MIPSQRVLDFNVTDYPIDTPNLNGAGDFQCKTPPELSYLNSEYLPIDDGEGGGLEGQYVGNPATNAIIELAEDIKCFEEIDGDEIKIFSVFLSNVDCSTCGPYPEFPFGSPTNAYWGDPTWSRLGYSLLNICTANKTDPCDEICEEIRNTPEEISTTVDFGRLLMK